MHIVQTKPNPAVSYGSLHARPPAHPSSAAIVTQGLLQYQASQHLSARISCDAGAIQVGASRGLDGSCGGASPYLLKVQVGGLHAYRP